MKWGKWRDLGDSISLTARPRALFQRQRQAVLLNVDLAAIFPLAQFLEQSEQGTARVRVLLRGASGAHGVDVFVAGHVTHQQFIVAETRPAELAAHLF